MRPLFCFPKVSRKLQRSLKNLRVSLFCFLLTFLVLRNTIGAGRFGTPAQDFEEIKLHLHNVVLHRKYSRVLAEAVEEKNVPLLIHAGNQRNAAFFGGSERGREEEGNAETDPRLLGAGERRKPFSEKRTEESGTPLPIFKQMQGNAAWLTTLDGKRRDFPILAAVGKDLQAKRLRDWDKQMRLRGSRAQGGPSKVLLLHSSPCDKPANELLLFQSFQNKVDYSTLHGFQVSTSSSCLDTQASEEPHSSPRLFQLRSSMLKHPHAEWLWWMPHAALFITNKSFELPFHRYAEFNLVLLGSVGAAYHRQKDLSINLNSDTFLIRNCQWSLAFLRSQRMVGTGFMDTVVLTGGPFIRKADDGKDDTSRHRILSAQDKALREKVYVEESSVLQGHWPDVKTMFEVGTQYSQAGLAHKQRLPFLTHILNCEEYGQGGSRHEEGTVCSKVMKKVLMFAEKQFRSQGKSSVSS